MRTLVRLFPVLAAALLAAPGCHATFDVKVSSKSTVPGGGLFQTLLPNGFGDFTSLDLSQTSDFKNAGVAKGDVESVKLTALKLTVAAPPDGTLEFIDDISFFVEADGLPRVKVAEAHGIPNDAKTVALTMTGVEIAAYVTAPKLSLTTEATAHAPKSDTQLQADAVFTVDPKIL